MAKQAIKCTFCSGGLYHPGDGRRFTFPQLLHVFNFRNVLSCKLPLSFSLG